MKLKQNSVTAMNSGREDQHPGRGLHLVRAFGDQHAPRGQRLLHAEAQERQEAFGQNDAGDGQRHIDDHRAQHIGHDVAADDAEGADTPAARAASTNSFCLIDSVWPRTIRAMVSHSTAPMATNSRMKLRSNDHHQDDDEEDEGQRIEHVDEAHHQLVDPAADEAGGRAVESRR